MDIQTTTITTKEHIIQFSHDDWIEVKLSHGEMFGIKYNMTAQKLELYALREGSILPPPVFVIGFDELDTAILSKNIEYVTLSFPKKYYSEVRKRLKDLPIFLPVEEK